MSFASAYFCLRGVFLVAVVAPLLAAAPPVHDGRKVEPKSLAQVLADVHVVEGKISSTEPLPRPPGDDGTVSEVQFDVWRVYCGEGLTENSKFTALVGEGRPGLALENWQLPLLGPKDRDHRIWLIEWDADRGRYTGQPRVGTLQSDPSAMSLTDAGFLLPFLGHERADAPKKLAAAPKVAAALYSLAKTKDEAERVRLLEDQACTGGPYVAVTDCWLLFQADAMPDRNKIAMRLFLDPKVPIPARTSFDNLLRRTLGSELRPTPERDKAFLAMAASARTEADFYSLGIEMRRRAGCGLSIATCLAVTRAALQNEHFLKTCDEHAAAGFVDFAESAKSQEDHEKVFEFFAPLIGAPADSHFEYAAVWAIRNPLTPVQVQRLSRVRARSPLAIGQLSHTLWEARNSGGTK